MNFLDVFNEIQKGNYALTDEAVYGSLQNKDELVPLYGGNKDHTSTERRISISAKTKKGERITVFSGEGIIISLDGSAGCMTYKNGERFALNHHAGFITVKKEVTKKVCLPYFALFFQNFYKNLSVSDGSKTLSLEQVYSEEFDLPAYDIQCNIMATIQNIKIKLDALAAIKEKYYSTLSKELIAEYKEYQGKDVEIKKCIDYMSGNSGLTEEYIYHTLQMEGQKYPVLSSATEERTMMGVVPKCKINNKDLKVFEGKEGLLVTRNGKAGQTRYLAEGAYTINDHAYILFNREDSKYYINLKWLAIQYRSQFLMYSSSADNGTWNMTGFFEHTKLDIPSKKEQDDIVTSYEKLEKRIEMIIAIEKHYQNLLQKEIAS